MTARKSGGIKSELNQDLIEKMKKAYLNYYVIEYYYEQMNANIQICKKLTEENKLFTKTREYEEIDEYYYQLNGFIYGLLSTKFISHEEKEKLISELLDMCNSI